MRALPSKLKPAQGFSHYFHIGLTTFLPAIIFILIRIDFAAFAFATIFLSKWRMFVVRPRYWLINIISNAVDIIVGLSVVVFMESTSSAAYQLLWALLYGVWLILLKPRSSTLMVSIQALVSQAVGLTAIYIAWHEAPMLGVVVLTWLVSYLSARHFFTSFEDEYTAFYSHTWAYFSAALTWILSHWLLFYGALPQPALLLTVFSFGLAGLYYLEDGDKLSPLVKKQMLFIMFAITLVVIIFSDWGDKTV